MKHTLLPAYFGEFGGQYVPESLIPALDQLEAAFVEAQNDPEFRAELAGYLKDYLGRPTPLTLCSKLPKAGKARGTRGSSSNEKTSFTAAHTKPTK